MKLDVKNLTVRDKQRIVYYRALDKIKRRLRRNGYKKCQDPMIKRPTSTGHNGELTVEDITEALEIPEQDYKWMLKHVQDIYAEQQLGNLDYPDWKQKNRDKKNRAYDALYEKHAVLSLAVGDWAARDLFVKRNKSWNRGRKRARARINGEQLYWEEEEKRIQRLKRRFGSYVRPHEGEDTEVIRHGRTKYPDGSSYAPHISGETIQDPEIISVPHSSTNKKSTALAASPKTRVFPIERRSRKGENSHESPTNIHRHGYDTQQESQSDEFTEDESSGNEVLPIRRKGWEKPSVSRPRSKSLSPYFPPVEVWKLDKHYVSPDRNANKGKHKDIDNASQYQDSEDEIPAWRTRRTLFEGKALNSKSPLQAEKVLQRPQRIPFESRSDKSNVQKATPDSDLSASKEDSSEHDYDEEGSWHGITSTRTTAEPEEHLAPKSPPHDWGFHQKVVQSEYDMKRAELESRVFESQESAFAKHHTPAWAQGASDEFETSSAASSVQETYSLTEEEENSMSDNDMLPGPEVQEYRNRQLSAPGSPGDADVPHDTPDNFHNHEDGYIVERSERPFQPSQKELRPQSQVEDQERYADPESQREQKLARSLEVDDSGYALDNLHDVQDEPNAYGTFSPQEHHTASQIYRHMQKKIEKKRLHLGKNLSQEYLDYLAGTQHALSVPSVESQQTALMDIPGEWARAIPTISVEKKRESLARIVKNKRSVPQLLRQDGFLREAGVSEDGPFQTFFDRCPINKRGEDLVGFDRFGLRCSGQHLLQFPRALLLELYMSAFSRFITGQAPKKIPDLVDIQGSCRNLGLSYRLPELHAYQAKILAAALRRVGLLTPNSASRAKAIQISDLTVLGEDTFSIFMLKPRLWSERVAQYWHKVTEEENEEYPRLFETPEEITKSSKATESSQDKREGGDKRGHFPEASGHEKKRREGEARTQPSTPSGSRSTASHSQHRDNQRVLNLQDPASSKNARTASQSTGKSTETKGQRHRAAYSDETLLTSDVIEVVPSAKVQTLDELVEAGKLILRRDQKKNIEDGNRRATTPAWARPDEDGFQRGVNMSRRERELAKRGSDGTSVKRKAEGSAITENGKRKRKQAGKEQNQAIAATLRDKKPVGGY